MNIKLLCLLLMIMSLHIMADTKNDSILSVKFSQTIKSLQDEYNNLPKSADKMTKLSLVNKLVLEYEKLPATVQRKFAGYKSIYYDAACYNALINKKKRALDLFDVVAQDGLITYSHALKDADLANLRKEKRFMQAMSKLQQNDFLYILQHSNAYASDSIKFQFSYANPNDSGLVKVREYFNLDSIAGSGDEISKMKNLMYWVHDVVRHDGNTPSNPEKKNAIDIVKICKAENRGVNCRMMAQMLNECYLAMGFKARYVTCMPKVYISDCHVINVVYSNTLNKWIWMDPTFAAYVSDEKGNLLSIEEVRERIRTNQTLIVNKDANWNHKEKYDKEKYLDNYMTKNLYYFVCVENTGFNTETYPKNQTLRYISLCPAGYTPDQHSCNFSTTDNKHFWQQPY